MTVFHGIVCPTISIQHFKTMFNKKKNTHTWERSAIDIDEREVIQIILFTYLLIFLVKIHGNSFTKIYTWDGMLKPIFIWNHSEFLAQFFNIIIRVCCNTKLKNIISRVLKPVKLEGPLQRRNLGNCRTFYEYVFNREVFTNTE